MDVYITYLVLLAWELWDPIRTMQLTQSRQKQGGKGTWGHGNQGTRGLGGQWVRGQGGCWNQVARGASLWRSKNWLNNGIFQI